MGGGGRRPGDRAVIPNAGGAPDDFLERAPDGPSSDARAPGDLLTRLEQIGAERYHHRHPFNLLMHAGKLDREDLRLWVANRYYYQTRIPIKDALIVAKAEDQCFRQVWTQRLLDHDGRRDPRSAPQGAQGNAPGSNDQGEPAGGLELWRRLGAALGLSAEELESRALLLPAAQSACDEYVELVRSSDLVVAVASSLTEHFASNLLSVRIDAWLQHYPYVSEEALAYFRQRVTEIPGRRAVRSRLCPPARPNRGASGALPDRVREEVFHSLASPRCGLHRSAHRRSAAARTRPG